MRLQFVINNDIYNTIDIDVLRKPTEEESRAIENEIYDIMDLYEEENGDFNAFDYYDCAYSVVEKYVPLAENEVVKTFYI